MGRILGCTNWTYCSLSVHSSLLLQYLKFIEVNAKRSIMDSHTSTTNSSTVIMANPTTATQAFLASIMKPFGYDSDFWKQSMCAAPRPSDMYTNSYRTTIRSSLRITKPPRLQNLLRCHQSRHKRLPNRRLRRPSTLSKA
jgi:hypothetical protein